MNDPSRTSTPYVLTALLQRMPEGAQLRLYPSRDNPLHKEPVVLTRHGHYFWSDDQSDPDYTVKDVLAYSVRVEFL